MKKGFYTQRLVNTFPLNSDIRNDEQSLGQQVFNPIGYEFDKQFQYINNKINNTNLLFASSRDIGLYYSFNLPQSFSFNFTTDSFISPTVSGLFDNVFYAVELAEDNLLENFWEGATPSRLTIEEVVSGIQGDTLLSICSGNDSTIIVSELPFVNRLCLAASGIAEAIQTIGGKSSVPSVKITGLDRNQTVISEEVNFLYDSTKQSVFEYSTISGIELTGCGKVDTINIYSNRFAANQLDPYIRDYRDTSFYPSTEGRTLFWNLETPNVISLSSYDVSDPFIRMDGQSSRSAISSFLAIRDEIPLDLIDLTVDKYTSSILAVSSGQLHVFSADIELPDYSTLSGKRYDSAAVIEPSSYWITSGEDIGIDYIWRRPTIGIIQHRSSVEKPDGNKFSLEDGVEVAYHTDTTSWIVGEPTDKMLRPPEVYTIDQLGQYVYTLETMFTDNTIHVDKRIVMSSYIEPTISFDLSFSAIGIDMDSEGCIWILDNNWSKRRIQLHYDTMLIDISKKTLYFREEYEEIRVYA